MHPVTPAMTAVFVESAGYNYMYLKCPDKQNSLVFKKYTNNQESGQASTQENQQINKQTNKNQLIY